MNYIACQAPLSVGFSRQEYWSGLPFPFPGARLKYAGHSGRLGAELIKSKGDPVDHSLTSALGGDQRPTV